MQQPRESIEAVRTWTAAVLPPILVQELEQAARESQLSVECWIAQLVEGALATRRLPRIPPTVKAATPPGHVPAKDANERDDFPWPNQTYRVLV
jgi:hypothetical protein